MCTSGLVVGSGWTLTPPPSPTKTCLSTPKELPPSGRLLLAPHLLQVLVGPHDAPGFGLRVSWDLERRSRP